MIPKFQEESKCEWGGILLCPNCGFNYLYHRQIEIFERFEDAAKGIHVSVNGEDVKVNTDIRCNPSTRRYGLQIEFACENCHITSILTIKQHKGNTWVDFEAGAL